MATFVNFSDVLPDPVNKITYAGNASSSGLSGPGFVGVSFVSDKTTQVSRTNSGRGVHRENEAQHWEVDIKYNPMTRDEFDVVDSFLSARNSRLYPFYVVLPQYSKPKEPTFAAFAAANVISVKGSYNAGASNMMIDCVPSIMAGDPRPNDYFTITDTNDANHLKYYKITRVETNVLYQAGQPQPNLSERRIHIYPPLHKFVVDNAVVNFINPKMRVMQKGDTQEHDLDVDGLFQFGLSLEEIQP